MWLGIIFWIAIIFFVITLIIAIARKKFTVAIKTILIITAIISISIFLYSWYGGNKEDNTNNSSITKPIPNCISYTEAPNHIGENTCVTGAVNNIYTSNTNITFVNFCADYKSCSFSAVIFASDKDNFPDIKSYEGKEVEISGEIRDYEGRPQVTLKESSQLKLR